MKSLVVTTIVAASLFAMSAMGETVTAEPDAFLEYIEATGTQYIDTGVNAETGLKARLDFAWDKSVTSGSDWSLLAAATSNSDSNKRSPYSYAISSATAESRSSAMASSSARTPTNRSNSSAGNDTRLSRTCPTPIPLSWSRTA